MSREQWCSEISRQLQTEDNRIPVLNDIKEYLSNLTQNEATETAHLLQLPMVFDCLNDSNNEQVELACDILSLCLGSLSLGESTSRYHGYLERALYHPLPHAKIMALREIQRNVTNDPSLRILHQTALLYMVIRSVGYEDLAVGQLACEILKVIGSSEIGLGKLLTPEVRHVVSEVLETNEVIRLRFYEVFVHIAKQSDVLKSILDSSGLLWDIIREVESRDILLRMNIIELLSQLVVTDHGYRYLESKNVVKKLLQSLLHEDDPLSLQICQPGILRFFGQLAHKFPILLEQYTEVFRKILENIKSDDFTIVGVSLDTLGYVISTDSGKITIDATYPEFADSLTQIVERLGVFPNEIKTRALACVSNVFDAENANDSKISNVTKKWYTVMQGNPMEWIVKYAKNPFGEIRLGGLSVLTAISKHLWGHEVIRNTPGLIEFLMDRNVETIKDCKVMKYEIVKQLSNSSAFNHEMQRTMGTFVNEGPFYVHGVTEIAFEGNE